MCMIKIFRGGRGGGWVGGRWGSLTLFDMGAMMAPQNVFDHCAQTLKRRKLKLGDF